MPIRIRNQSSRRLPQRTGNGIFFLFFFAMGLVSLVLLARSLAQEFQAFTWPTAPCRIVDSSVAVIPNDASPYQLRATYSYTWNGKNYQSRQTTLGDAAQSKDYEPVARQAAQLADASQAICYVNPADPSQAVLQRGNLFKSLFILLPLIFIAVGARGIYMAWTGRIDLLPSSWRSKLDRSGLFLFFAIFFLVGSAIFIHASLPQLWQWANLSNWAKTPCTIERSWMHWTSGKHGRSYHPEILFAYRVNDRLYQSNQWQLSPAFSSRAANTATLAAYRPGAKTVCYVNPRDPFQAVLVPEMGWGGLLLLMPLLFVATGAGGLVWMIRSKPKGHQPINSITTNHSRKQPRRGVRSADPRP